MNPYGTRWRCKGKKNHTAPEQNHVTPALLRLDSTGEITSDSNSADRYIPDMGTLIDSALMKIQGRVVDPVTKRSFMDCKRTSNVMPIDMDSDFVLNQIQQKQAMDSHSKGSPYSAPHWGYHQKTPTRPYSCAFSNFRNSTNFCNPEFKNFQHQKTGFHPAMTGHCFGQRYPNRGSHRGQHMDGHWSNHRPRHSFLTERVPSDCTNWRKSSQENSLRDDCSVPKDRVESTAEPTRISDSTSQTLSHSKNDVDHDKETPKSVININCAMPSQEKSHEDLNIKMQMTDKSEVPATVGKEHDKSSNGQKSASVQIFDWFECGQSEETGGSDVPQRIGFRVRTLSIDSESSTDPSVVNNKTLQREASVLNDIFQPDDTVFHVTCRFQESDSMPANKESGSSTENHQPNERRPCSKDVYCESAVVGSTSESPQSTNCAEKKNEPSDLEKDGARRIVLFIGNNNKKGCRPSAKKRRRSKARKDLSEVPSCQENGEQKTQFQEKNCKEKSSQKSGATKTSGPANAVAFVLGFDSNNSPVSPLQHSFLVSFDSESDDFSENSNDDFSDSDGVDELDFFSCPLQLNVICPVKQPDATPSHQEPSPVNSCESEKRLQEILDVNLKWDMNFSVRQLEKSKTKVTFAEEDKLCTVYELEDEDRKGHWEEFVRDRERFQRRITEVEEIMKPVLSMERRDRIYHEYCKTERKGHLADD